MLNSTFTPITLIFTRQHHILHITPVRFQIVPDPEPSNLPGPQVNTCEGSRPVVDPPNVYGPQVGTLQDPTPTAVYPPTFNGPQVGTLEHQLPTEVYPPTFNGPQVGHLQGRTYEHPLPTEVYPPNFNGPQVGQLQGRTYEHPLPTEVYPPTFNEPQVGQLQGRTFEELLPTEVYPPNFNVAPPVHYPDGAGPQVDTAECSGPTAGCPPNFYVPEYVPEPGQNGNELSDELLSFIDSSMARVRANSMPPVYNQPPLPTPTPSTSTPHVGGLLLTKKTVVATKTGNFVIARREFFRHLSDFEDFLKAEEVPEYVPEPGQNGNELSDELLSFIDSSMARVRANSMPPVYNQPPLPTPTPSTSTPHVGGLLLTKKTVVATKTGNFVIARREFFRHLSDFEDFLKAEEAKEALEMEQIALTLANNDMMQIDPEHDNIPRHDLDIDVFDTLMGLTEKGEMHIELVECPVPLCNKRGPPYGLHNHYMMAHANQAIINESYFFETLFFKPPVYVWVCGTIVKYLLPPAISSLQTRRHIADGPNIASYVRDWPSPNP